MSGIDIVTLGASKRYTNSVMTGIASITATATGFEIICADGTKLPFTIPNWHAHSNFNNILEKFTLSNSGELLFDGAPLISSGGDKDIIVGSSLPSTGEEDKLYIVHNKTDYTLTVGTDLSEVRLGIDIATSVVAPATDKVLFESSGYKVVHKTTNRIVLENTTGTSLGVIYNGTTWTNYFLLPKDFGKLTNVSNETVITTIAPIKEDDDVYIYSKVNGFVKLNSALIGGIATETDLGMVKIGLGLTVQPDGTISLTDYTESAPDPTTGEITINLGGMTYVKDPTTGNITNISLGGAQIGSSTTVIPVTDTDGNVIGSQVITIETVGSQTTTITVNKDKDGNVTGTTTVQSINETIVNQITTNTSKSLDAFGNPITNSLSIITTPTGIQSITSQITTDKVTGNSSIIETTVNKGNNGLTKTTTDIIEKDSSGNVTSTNSINEYEGDAEMFMTRDDSDVILNDIFNEFNW